VLLLVVGLAVSQLAARARRLRVIAITDAGYGHPPRLERDGTVVTRNGRWPVDQSGLPMEEIELRTFGHG
jgi:hypothetical protein